MIAFKSKKIIVLCVVVVGVAVAATILFARQQSKVDKRNTVNNVELCVKDPVADTITKDNNLLKIENKDKLKAVNDKILAMSNYDKSATCLYIVTAYAINSGNTKGARESYDKLMALYKVDIGNKQATPPKIEIKSIPYSLSDLKVYIEGMEAREQELKKHSVLVPAGLPK